MHKPVYFFSSEGLNSFFLSVRSYYLIVLSVLLITGYYFLNLPILSIGDTDLWYHLSGGRYFFNHGEIARKGFFSFFAESREWSNYYWLFQVLVYQIFSVWEYYGLILFKTLIYLITVFTIAYYFLKNENNDNQIVYFVVLFILFCIGLIPRYYAFLRPHVCSYLFIPIFLYLIEFRGAKFVFLPLLTVLWVNLHGVEYPIITLITVSYLSEYLIRGDRETGSRPETKIFYPIILILSLWAVFINPYGFDLLKIPFNLADNQHHYIKELGALTFKEFFSFEIYPPGALSWSGLNILILVACISFIKGIVTKRMRISHLILFIGGFVLLTRSERFRYETVLLALPILKSYPLVCLYKNRNKPVPTVRSLIIIILVLLSFTLFHTILKAKEKYPFSYSHLPRGVATFLNDRGKTGTVLNSPDFGGYLQWKLRPGYKIAMDLQMVLFTDEDYFMVSNALSSKEGFQSFFYRFHPDYIIVKRSDYRFKEIVETFPEYKLVFFDDASVLYMNRKSHPGISARYGYKRIDPYAIKEEDIPSLKEERADALLKELLALQAIYPENMIVNFQIGNILKGRGEIERALRHANLIIRHYPEFSAGYLLRGDLFKERQLFKEAVSCYREALDCPIRMNPSMILKRMALAYYGMGDHKKAYRFMEKAVQEFSPDVNYKDLWQLGNMALKIGKIDRGMTLLRFALFKAPLQDKKFLQRVHDQLNKLEPYIVKQE